MIAALTQVAAALRCRNVWVLSLSICAILLAHEAWFPMLPVHLRRLGATDLQVGIVYTANAFSYALFQFLGGMLADRFGRKALIVIPMFLHVPLYLAAGQVTRWEWLAVLLAVASLLGAFQWPSFIALLAESVDEKLRGSAFAVFEISIALGIGGGTFFGSLILEKTGIPNLFILTAVVTLLAALARTFLLQETFSPRRADSTAPPPNPVRLLTPSLRWCFAGMVGFALLSSITLNGPFITFHAKDQIGLTEKEVYFIFLIAGGAAILTAPFSGWLADRIGPKLIFMLGGLGHGLFIIPWMLAGNLSAGIPFVFGAAASLQAGAIAKNSLVSRLTPTVARTSLVGMVGTLAGLVASIGPALGMKLKEWLGPQAPFWFAFLVGVATVLVLIPIKMPDPEPEGTGPAKEAVVERGSAAS